VVLGTNSTGLVMSVLKFGVSCAMFTGFHTMSCEEFLSTMMMTFLMSHPEASAWPLSLRFCSFLLFTLLPVNALSPMARFGVDWRLVTC
jgi:hypothetical protein